MAIRTLNLPTWAPGQLISNYNIFTGYTSSLVLPDPPSINNQPTAGRYPARIYKAINGASLLSAVGQGRGLNFIADGWPNSQVEHPIRMDFLREEDDYTADNYVALVTNICTTTGGDPTPRVTCERHSVPINSSSSSTTTTSSQPAGRYQYGRHSAGRQPAGRQPANHACLVPAVTLSRELAQQRVPVLSLQITTTTQGYLALLTEMIMEDGLLSNLPIYIQEGPGQPFTAALGRPFLEAHVRLDRAAEEAQTVIVAPRLLSVREGGLNLAGLDVPSVLSITAGEAAKAEPDFDLRALMDHYSIKPNPTAVGTYKLLSTSTAASSLLKQQPCGIALSGSSATAELIINPVDKHLGQYSLCVELPDKSMMEQPAILAQLVRDLASCGDMYNKKHVLPQANAADAANTYQARFFALSGAALAVEAINDTNVLDVVCTHQLLPLSCLNSVDRVEIYGSRRALIGLRAESAAVALNIMAGSHLFGARVGNSFAKVGMSAHSSVGSTMLLCPGVQPGTQSPWPPTASAPAVPPSKDPRQVKEVTCIALAEGILATAVPAVSKEAPWLARYGKAVKRLMHAPPTIVKQEAAAAQPSEAVAHEDLLALALAAAQTPPKSAQAAGAAAVAEEGNLRPMLSPGSTQVQKKPRGAMELILKSRQVHQQLAGQAPPAPQPAAAPGLAASVPAMELVGGGAGCRLPAPAASGISSLNCQMAKAGIAGSEDEDKYSEAMSESGENTTDDPNVGAGGQ